MTGVTVPRATGLGFDLPPAVVAVELSWSVREGDEAALDERKVLVL